MRISKFRTLWIMFFSGLNIINTCGRATIKFALGSINRQWVNKSLLLWSNRVLGLAKVTCKIINPHGVEPQPGKATIVMCNHTSLYDIPLSLQVFPKHSIRMLAKKELSTIPVMGKGMKASEFPFVDRKNRSQSIKDLEHARQLMESGIVMWIFPEGTRSKDGKLSAFKKGSFITAIEAKATIIPVGICGAYDILPAKTMQLNLNQTAEIFVGQPIDASQYSVANKEELIAAVHESIRKLTTVPNA